MRALHTVLAFILLCSGTTLPAGAYNLAFKDSAGESLVYKIELAQKGVTLRLNGSSMPINQFVAIHLTTTAVAPSTGAMILAQTIKNGTLTTILDGLKKQQELPAYTLLCERAPKGNIGKLKVEHDIKNAMLRPEEMARGLGFLGALSSAFQFPREITDGESWRGPEEVEVAPGIITPMAAIYKLSGTKRVDGKLCVQIDGDITLSFPAQMTATGSGLQVSTAVLDMTFKGTTVSLFDEQAGELRNCAFNGTLTMSLETSDIEARTGNCTKSLTIAGVIKLVGKVPALATGNKYLVIDP